MNKKNFLYIGISVVVLGIVASLIFSQYNNDSGINSGTLSELNFTYVDSNAKLKESLESNGVSMSSTVKLSTIKDIEKYCSFFGDKTIQEQVEYCTSTELHDADGAFLGNIHMVGSKNLPKIVLVVIQTNPFFQNLDEIKSVYDIVIENLVCDCWADVKPSQIETVGDWVDTMKDFHTSDVKPTSQSSLSIRGMNLEMELTTNTEGYLWKLIISR